MRTTIVLRGMSFAAVVLAGSCAAPTNQMGDPTVFADGAVNHPITVAPAYRFSISAIRSTSGPLMPDSACPNPGSIQNSFGSRAASNSRWPW